MSMTQEEIEALMNDTATNDESLDESSIDDLLEGIDGIVEDDEDESQNVEDTTDSLDDIINNDSEVPDDSKDTLDEKKDAINDSSSIEDIINEQDDTKNEVSALDEQIKEDNLEEKIDKGVFPLPSSDEHKVVNQLNEVAEDTEKKASQIFDVLSYLLDENEKQINNLNSNKEFIDSQIELLTQLVNKFPNIEILKENLQKANETKEKNSESITIVEEQNNKIFEAMELMQYHDINRQKIERVMSVIKKLANYLNGIFVDDSNKNEVQIAKHISGDSSESLNDDDLDSLIAEFNN